MREKEGEKGDEGCEKPRAGLLEENGHRREKGENGMG